MANRSSSFIFSHSFTDDDSEQYRAPGRIPEIVVGDFLDSKKRLLFQAVDMYSNGEKFSINFIKNTVTGLHTAFIKCVNDALHPGLFEFLEGWRDVHDPTITVKLNTSVTREYSASFAESRLGLGRGRRNDSAPQIRCVPEPTPVQAPTPVDYSAVRQLELIRRHLPNLLSVIESWDSSIENPLAEMVELKCMICLKSCVEIPSDQLRITSCRHKACGACLEQWLRDNETCPVCRQRVTSVAKF